MSDQRLYRRSILVVEDEYFVADDMVRLLHNAGAAVIGPIADADLALRNLARFAPDAAALDINLNEDRVYALADALIRRRVPFGFFTGYCAEMVPDDYRDIPRWEKPHQIDRVVAGLATLLKQPL